MQSGVDMVGIGTALAIDPYLPRDWLQGKERPAIAADHLEKQDPCGLGEHGGREVSVAQTEAG